MGLNPKTYQLITNSYDLDQEEVSIQGLAQGLINDTYVITVKDQIYYLLQKINNNVFKHADVILENQTKAIERLKNHNKSYPDLINTKEGTSFVIDAENNYWRLSEFVSNSKAYNASINAKMAQQAGILLGEFHKALAGEKPESYRVHLAKFNDLTYRFDQFDSAVQQAKKERLDQANELMGFIEVLKPLLLHHNLQLPSRVCHNDTKLNNILFSTKEQKALCLIDLDTLMPGYLFYDFGDLFRTAAFSAQEGELNLDSIKLDKEYTKELIQGFTATLDTLTTDEYKSLSLGAVYMPFIHGLRALTDFLSNDIYYKVNYPKENLDRAKSLFRFANEAHKNNAYIDKCIKESLK